jgi:hypothetical protein
MTIYMAKKLSIPPVREYIIEAILPNSRPVRRVRVTTINRQLLKSRVDKAITVAMFAKPNFAPCMGIAGSIDSM